MCNYLTTGRRQRIASGMWDTEEPLVDEPFGKCHDLWGAAVEIENTGFCRLDALEECDPRGGRLAPVRRGN